MHLNSAGIPIRFDRSYDAFYAARVRSFCAANPVHNARFPFPNPIAQAFQEQPGFLYLRGEHARARGSGHQIRPRQVS